MTTHSATTDATSIEVPSDLPLVRITREFDAPVEKVLRAHVDPALVVQWLGPSRYEMRIERWDAVTGGAYRYVHAGDGNEFWFHGSFHDVRPDRIVQTFAYEGFPDSVALVTLRLVDLGGGRTRLEATSMAGSFEARDAFVASGMEYGVREGYQRLDALLARA